MFDKLFKRRLPSTILSKSTWAVISSPAGDGADGNEVDDGADGNDVDDDGADGNDVGIGSIVSCRFKWGKLEGTVVSSLWHGDVIVDVG